MIDGGWGVDPNMQKCVLPAEVDKAFHEVFGNMMGVKYTPVLYCGQQIVAGTNHMIICKAEPVVKDPAPYLVKVSIHIPLSGKAEILKLQDLEPFGRK